MKTSKLNSSITYAAMVVAAMVALRAWLPAQTAEPVWISDQTAALKSSPASSGSTMQWSVQVDRVNSGDLELAYSFQVAIYENLLQELNRTKQFKQVFRDGDRKAGEIPKLLILKTTVEEYKPGSETQRAVTTVSGATKLTVRSQLITREGKIVLDRKVHGEVRFFGSNLRATHNLARNIAKVINQSPWSVSEQPGEMLAGQL